MDKRKVGILSLGCPRNLVDSEYILGRISLKGYQVVDMDKADIGIVNTCCFIEDAKAESSDAILELIDLKKRGRLKKIIVYGCLTQRYKNKLIKELPEVDAFVGTISLNHNRERLSITPGHYAYLKISEGCINNCSYCIIPKIKSRFTSLDINSVLERIELFDKDRICELNIIGQDITGYGIDLYGTYRLTWLLKRILKKTCNIRWLRLLYLYPGRISNELLELIKNESRICKYIDLPIQHINDRILKLMHRHTTSKDISTLIDKIRKIIPNVAIRTSLIVGFPSESDKEFKELLKFIEDVKFERLGVFTYSREEDTPAYNLKRQIPLKIKIERFNIIMAQQQKISQDINKKFLGRTMEVLIEESQDGFCPALPTSKSHNGVKKEGVYLARSQYDAPEVDGLVYVKSKKELKAGDFVKVNITNTLEYDLVGEVKFK